MREQEKEGRMDQQQKPKKHNGYSLHTSTTRSLAFGVAWVTLFEQTNTNLFFHSWYRIFIGGVGAARVAGAHVAPVAPRK
jgi:hypothetical protein